MTGRLRAVVSPFRLNSAPLLLAASPSLAGALLPRSVALPLPGAALLPRSVALPLLLAAFPMFFAAGCSEPAQEASKAPAAPSSSATTAAPSHEPVYLTSETTARMNLPFSDAVRVGHLLFLSGQIGNLPGTTDLAPGGIQGEARQTMENIRTVLEANGSSMDRVIKATVMLADISEWPAFNEVYVTYFPGEKPARSAFAGSGLAFGARCEVEVIATVGE